jgi:hypothetical protein
MINPVVETYYKDVSRPPKAGDEFIELAWAYQPIFELNVIRGVFDDKSKNKTKHYMFWTSKQLEELVEGYRKAVLQKGFKPYQIPYVLSEGKVV